MYIRDKYSEAMRKERLKNRMENGSEDGTYTFLDKLRTNVKNDDFADIKDFASFRFKKAVLEYTYALQEVESVADANKDFYLCNEDAMDKLVESMGEASVTLCEERVELESAAIDVVDALDAQGFLDSKASANMRKIECLFGRNLERCKWTYADVMALYYLVRPALGDIY